MPDLKAELQRFIEVHNEHSAKPFKWAKPAADIIPAVARAKKTLHNSPHGPLVAWFAGKIRVPFNPEGMTSPRLVGLSKRWSIGTYL